MANAYRSTMTITCPATSHRITLERAPMRPNEDGEIEFDCRACGTHHVVTIIRQK
jgi:hypothetical protein